MLVPTELRTKSSTPGLRDAHSQEIAVVDDDFHADVSNCGHRHVNNNQGKHAVEEKVVGALKKAYKQESTNRNRVRD